MSPRERLVQKTLSKGADWANNVLTLRNLNLGSQKDKVRRQTREHDKQKVSSDEELGTAMSEQELQQKYKE